MAPADVVSAFRLTALLMFLLLCGGVVAADDDGKVDQPLLVSDPDRGPATGAVGRIMPAPSTVGWMPWPLVQWRASEEEASFAIHPLFRRRLDRRTGEKSTDVLWPFIRHKRDPLTPSKTDQSILRVFPLAVSESATRDGNDFHHTTIFPLFYSGRGETGGRYIIGFPFFWWADEARLRNPFFPSRPQTFAALWPIAGRFHHYYNRDLIEFYLWPLFVHSAEGEADERVDLYSAPWPFLGYYTGPTTKGFRVWPLWSHVAREDEFRRGYFLWPLGHYGREFTPEDEKRPEEMFVFLPFYGRVRDEKLSYDLVFPFYGRLNMKGRETRGYALAIYNENDNLRRGIRQHRVLWFLIRWTSDIPRAAEFEPEPGERVEEPMRGGGVFPFYLKRTNETKLRETIAWPIYTRKIDEYPDFDFTRSYFLPFYGRQQKEFADGRESVNNFVFPLFRYTRTAEGRRYSSAPHLFPYSAAEPMDRNWAPLWSVWTEEQNEETGERKTRVLGPVWQNDRNWSGARRRELNLGIVSVEKWDGDYRPKERHVEFLWGLVSHDRLGEKSEWRFLGR